eukprot:2260163-Pleurochrysis_carterae.AAC.1
MMQLSPRVEQPDKCNLPAGRSEYADGADGLGPGASWTRHAVPVDQECLIWQTKSHFEWHDQARSTKS